MYSQAVVLLVAFAYEFSNDVFHDINFHSFINIGTSGGGGGGDDDGNSSDEGDMTICVIIQ
jgi:hypothetical protein